MCLLHRSVVPPFCDTLDCSPPGSSAHGIFQERILEWVAVSCSRDLPIPGIIPASSASPALAGGFFTTTPPEGHLCSSCLCQPQTPGLYPSTILFPLVTINFFLKSVSLFLLCKYVHVYHRFRFHI